MGWLEKAADEVRAVAGNVKGVSEITTDAGSVVFVMIFDLGGDRFKVQWPVLTPRVMHPVNAKSAKIQAATALYHDVKARCVTLKFLGSRDAFMPFLLLEGGKTVSEAVPEVFLRALPEVVNHE